MKKELELIYKTQHDLFVLNGIEALLDWDLKTHMPEKGLEGRAEQLKKISELVHDKICDNKLNQALNKLMKNKDKLDKKDQIVVEVFNKDVKRARKLPKEFVKQMVHQEVIAHAAWEKARKKNSFKLFLPELKKLLALKKKEARLINPRKPLYDNLMNDYEEGMTAEKVRKVFDPLKKELIALIKKIKSTESYKKQKQLVLEMSKNDQMKLSDDVSKKMGLSFDEAQLDVSVHPFTTRIAANDVRITTRFIDPSECFLSTVHETGHALYELGYPDQYKYTVVHDAPSLGLHESQSRIWENIFMKSEEFWKGYAPVFNKFLKKKFTWQQLHKDMNLVTPSFIRVDADEVTYCLHVILRFEIEEALINGTLKLEDAQKVWNAKMKEYLGITPKTDNDGILQDTHWSGGSFGYFPTYALGSIYSAQLFAKMMKDIPNARQKIQKLEFKPFLDWLRKNVHSKGRTMLADDIVKKATGKGLDYKVFVSYLNEKYGKIYGF